LPKCLQKPKAFKFSYMELEISDEIQMIRERHTEKIIFALREDGILCTSCVPDTIMTLEEARFSTRITNELQENIPHPLLCDLSNVVKMTKECREHFAGKEHGETFTKSALLVSNPISKIIGNFFLGLNKPIKPTRLFTNKEKAIEWLKSS